MPKNRMRISRIRIESESDPEPQTESESQPNPNQPNPNLDRIRIPIYRIRIETLPNRIPNRIPGSWNSIPDQIPSELSLKPNPNRTESVRPSSIRLSDRPAGRFSEIWQSNKKISKNRCYPLKSLEFHVESPKGNKIKEIPNFKETSFFRHFVRPAGRFSEIWQSNKKISKNRCYPLKSLEFHVESPKGN